MLSINQESNGNDLAYVNSRWWMCRMNGYFIDFRKLDQQSRLRGIDLRSKDENEWEELIS